MADDEGLACILRHGGDLLPVVLVLDLVLVAGADAVQGPLATDNASSASCDISIVVGGSDGRGGEGRTFRLDLLGFSTSSSSMGFRQELLREFKTALLLRPDDVVVGDGGITSEAVSVANAVADAMATMAGLQTVLPLTNAGHRRRQGSTNTSSSAAVQGTDNGAIGAAHVQEGILRGKYGDTTGIVRLHALAYIIEDGLIQGFIEHLGSVEEVCGLEERVSGAEDVVDVICHDGWMDRWMDGWMDGWMNGKEDGGVGVCLFLLDLSLLEG